MNLQIESMVFFCRVSIWRGDWRIILPVSREFSVRMPVGNVVRKCQKTAFWCGIRVFEAKKRVK